MLRLPNQKVRPDDKWNTVFRRVLVSSVKAMRSVYVCPRSMSPNWSWVPVLPFDWSGWGATGGSDRWTTCLAVRLPTLASST